MVCNLQLGARDSGVLLHDYLVTIDSNDVLCISKVIGQNFESFHHKELIKDTEILNLI